MKTLFILGMSVLTAASAFAAPKIEAGKYGIDPAHSKVGFEISHLVISTVEGRFDTFTGNVEMGKKIDDTKIDASIDVNSISTGNGDRDKHLKSPDFFDAAKFGTITFVSKSVSGATDHLAIKGDLTIHGVTKPVTLDGKYMGVVNDPYGNTKVAFSAKGKISRKDFGLIWSKMVEAGPVVGDEVTLDIRIEAGKPGAAPAKK
jgi:polyisoprenoid-binding protein YceI